MIIIVKENKKDGETGITWQYFTTGPGVPLSPALLSVTAVAWPPVIFSFIFWMSLGELRTRISLASLLSSVWMMVEKCWLRVPLFSSRSLSGRIVMRFCVSSEDYRREY